MATGSDAGPLPVLVLFMVRCDPPSCAIWRWACWLWGWLPSPGRHCAATTPATTLLPTSCQPTPAMTLRATAAAGDGAPGDSASGVAADAGTADGSAAATTVPSSGTESSAETTDDPASDATTTVATTAVPPEPIEVLGEADTLTGLDGWLNTDATSLEEIRAANTLTVVQFWTFGCRNCKNTLEALGQLYADFRGQGVEIVGVHSPEFSYEADVDNIIEAAADLGVIWPIALDTDKRNFHRWQEGNIGYWPRVYVIDGVNQIRFDRTGDGRATYAQLYETVERLLAEA